MATATKRKDEDVLTCCVCLDGYTDPCTLHCKHSFCRRCITDYVKTQEDAVQDKLIPCPFCRQMTRVPDPSRPLDEWAGQLKPGHVVQELMATVNKDTTVEEPQCSVCQHQGKNTQGKFWCAECEETYCQGCATIHSAMAISRDHDLCDVKDKGKTRRRKPKCNDHKDQLLQLYCKICNISHCQLCYIDHHKKCEDVVTVKSFVSNMKTELSELNNHLENQEKKFKNLVENQKTRISLINTDKVSVIGEIRCASQKAVEVIKKKEELLINQAEEITRRESIELKVQVKLGNIQIQTYRQYSEYIKQALSSDSEMEVCDVYQVWKSGQLEVSQKGDEKSGGGNISSVRFSQQKQNITEVLDSLHLGEIITTYLPTDSLSSPCLSESMDTRVELDENAPYIHDVIVLDVQGVQTTVVTDSNNNCVKSFFTKKNKNCHSRIQLEGEVRGLTKLEGNKVMVAVPNLHQIEIVAVTPDLNTETHISTSKPYYSLTVIKPSRLAAGGLDSVDIINIQGEVLRSIPTHSNMEFSENSNFMCVSSIGHLFVSDVKKKNVTCLASEGETVWIFPDAGKGKLKNPTGIITVGGDILVADSSLKKVIQLSDSGQLIRDVVTSRDGIRDPKGLFVDKHGSLFICDSGKLLKFVFIRIIRNTKQMSILSPYVQTV